jgi:hypothetical protein
MLNLEDCVLHLIVRVDFEKNIHMLELQSIIGIEIHICYTLPME